MIDLYYWTTPNGHKITIFLEETGLPYRLRPVNLGRGEQFNPAFLAISPNNKIPAIVDDEPVGGGEPLKIFESGAVLMYLAEKTGQLLPHEMRGRFEVIEWVFWQVGGLGPMVGERNRFVHRSPEKIPYAIDHFEKENHRLYGVMNKRLEDRPYLAGDYSIADIASYPWVLPAIEQELDMSEFPNLIKWLERISRRPAVVRAYQRAEEINPRRPRHQPQPEGQAAPRT